MRQLKTKDIFTMSKILEKLELKIDAENKSQEQLGAELILKIGENLHKAEKEINEFLADLKEITVEEFENLSIKEVINIFNEFKNLEGVKDFLSSAGR